MLDGLAHAHARGIVHRDVKPSNVLLEDAETVSVKLLDFGLAQFDEADTLTAVGDVPGTLAYIAPERLSGEEASTASDVWAVGVILWEALASRHPFWGVPLPQVAATIEAGAPPLKGERPDLSRKLLVAVEGALAIEPARRPRAGELAATLRETLDAPLHPRHHIRRPRPAPARLSRSYKLVLPEKLRQPRKLAIPATPAALEARALSAGLAGLATVVGGSLLPFWTPGLLALLAVTAALAAWSVPRLGLAIALFAPLFPLGNEAKGAALLYGAFAIGLLAAGWRDPRAGLAFAAGPLLAPVGGLALVPLAVQPVRGWLRRGIHAALALPAAAVVAGVRGNPLPLVGDHVGNLGLAATTHPGTVFQAVWATLSDNPAIGSTAIVLGIAAALLPFARDRGRAAIAALCAGEVGLILLSAPSVAPTSIVLGGWALCGALTLGRSR